MVLVLLFVALKSMSKKTAICLEISSMLHYLLIKASVRINLFVVTK